MRTSPVPATPAPANGALEQGAEAAPGESVIVPGARRAPGRALVLVVAALWVAFLVVLAIVVVLWHTAPMHPIRLTG